MSEHGHDMQHGPVSDTLQGEESMIELPPLPYGASPAYGYTEAEMRAYGEACARAALEAAAVMLDSEHESRKHADNHAAFYARKVRAMAIASGSVPQSPHP
jgi:hypothetical protein